MAEKPKCQTDTESDSMESNNENVSSSVMEKEPQGVGPSDILQRLLSADPIPISDFVKIKASMTEEDYVALAMQYCEKRKAEEYRRQEEEKKRTLTQEEPAWQPSVSSKRRKLTERDGNQTERGKTEGKDEMEGKDELDEAAASNTDKKDEGKLKSAMKVKRCTGEYSKKNVRWREDRFLEQVKYFPWDPTERAYVGRWRLRVKNLYKNPILPRRNLTKT